jgi:hypothetical protein
MMNDIFGYPVEEVDDFPEIGEIVIGTWEDLEKHPEKYIQQPVSAFEILGLRVRKLKYTILIEVIRDLIKLANWLNGLLDV